MSSSFDNENKELTAEQQEFAKLLESYDYNFQPGEIIRGTITSVDNGGAIVDVGAKSSAILNNKEIVYPVRPASEVLNVGDEYEFYILGEKGEDGQLLVSLRRVLAAQNWAKLEEIFEGEGITECTVTSAVKGGLLVEVMGLRGFIPASHVRIKKPLESLVGETIEAKLISLDKQRNNVILSHRKLVSEQMAEQRRGLFDNINEGDKLEGEVVRLTDFGAFVDLGGVDGLLPLSQMSWRWVEHPSDILNVGDKLTVEVIGIDRDKQRVSLSIKGSQTDPWQEISNEMGLGDEVEGKVTRIKHFGAFVEIFPGVEALLPTRDIQDKEAEDSSFKLEPGSSVKTFIVKFSPDERRISLSFHKYEGNDYTPNAGDEETVEV